MDKPVYNYVVANKPDLRTKAGKLWLGIQKGKTKKVAAIEAGLNPKNVSKAMATENYQALERSSYREEILKHITMAQIAGEHVKVIVQDKDLGAKNTAIKMAYEKIEPEAVPDKDEQKVLVILR